jgi:hypothetical protein
MIAKGIVAAMDNCGGTYDPAQTENPLEHPDGSHPQAPKAGWTLEVSDHLNARDAYNGKVSVFAASGEAGPAPG